MATEELDATGLKCPLPVLKTRKRMKALTSGDILVVQSTDPGSPLDMKAFCEQGGHNLDTEDDGSGVFRFTITKA